MFPQTSNGQKPVDMFLANLKTVDMFLEPKVRTGGIVDMFLTTILRTGTKNDYLFRWLVPPSTRELINGFDGTDTLKTVFQLWTKMRWIESTKREHGLLEELPMRYGSFILFWRVDAEWFHSWEGCMNMIKWNISFIDDRDTTKSKIPWLTGKNSAKIHLLYIPIFRDKIPHWYAQTSLDACSIADYKVIAQDYYYQF